MAVTAAPSRARTRTEKGASLARGPALILGTILLVAGLYFLYKEHFFPQLSNFPNGHAPIHSKVFLGIFGANGWTGMLTAAAGGLLLFGAAQHLLAKTMSLIVGVALGAAAVIALISGNVLGLAAANHLTELAWGVCAVILLVNTLVPRRRREVLVDQPVADDRRVAEDRTAVADRDAAGRRHSGVGAAAAGGAVGAAAEHEHDRHEAAGERGTGDDRTGVVDRPRGEPGDDRTVADDSGRTAVHDRTAPSDTVRD